MTFKTFATLLAITAASAANAAGTSAGGNEVYIDQTDNNYAEVNQDCDAAGCDNIAGITQVYTDYQGNAGAINNAVINQYTNDNEAYITQRGNNNNANIAQRLGAKASIEQIDAFDSTAIINQDRDEIDGTLSGTGNVASAYQSGLVHNALIKQFGDFGEAHTRQTGDGHQAKIIQNKGSVNEYASVTQEGWTNYADVVQNGQNDSAVLFQSGKNNVLDVDMAVTSRGSTIHANQVGSDNQAKLFTQGENNTIIGSQNDTANYIEVVQLGNQQTATYNQDGVSNNAFIGQYETANGSSASISQFGVAHNATILQHCPNSTASIIQRGTGAVAVVTQNAPR